MFSEGSTFTGQGKNMMQEGTEFINIINFPKYDKETISLRHKSKTEIPICVMYLNRFFKVLNKGIVFKFC